MAPILPGTLEEKVERAGEIQSKIQLIRKGGVRASTELDKLLKSGEELEVDIDRHLMGGEKIEDPLLDYCLRHFFQTSHIDGLSGGIQYTPSAFERVEAIRTFMGEVKKFKGGRILITYGEFPTDAGVISADCKFRIEEIFRKLVVPVDQLFAYYKSRGKWEEGRTQYNPKIRRQEPIENIIQICPGIFETVHRFKTPNREMWETCNAGKQYIGGSPPEETRVYLGNGYVNDRLKSLKVKSPF